MTVPHIFTAGTTAKSAEVNENFAFVHIHRKLLSDATTRSTTSGTFVDSGTSFTLSTPDNALILGFAVRMTISTSNAAARVASSIEFSGSTLPTTYLRGVHFRRNLTDSAGNFYHNFHTKLSTSEDDLFEADPSAGSIDVGTSYFGGLKLTDTSTTIKVRLRNSAGSGHSVSISNVQIDVIYVEGFTED